MQLNRKGTAEFFRLGLLTGLCAPSDVTRWADSIVAADSSPHIAFIELCVAGSQSANNILTLLKDVPGESNRDLPVLALLGWSSRLLSSQDSTPEQVLLRLYRIASSDTFPENIYFEIMRLEDELFLAGEGIYGTPADVARDIINFLKGYESFAPEL